MQWGGRFVTRPRPVFHKGNSSNKEKEKRTKKEKENGLWKMPQLWKSAKQSVACGALFVDADSHSCLESLEKTRGFPHLPQTRLR
jgi:hypothetical protein